MKQKWISTILIFITLTLFQYNFSFADEPTNIAKSTNRKIVKESCFADIKFGFHNDTIHKLNFRYADKKRGLKPYIAPALLISAGTALHFSTDAKVNFQDWVQSKFAYSGDVDDYIQFAPLAAVYSLNAFGVKGKNNFGNSTAIAIKSILLN
ncbi:MAG: hypothetical protein L3J54_13600, partial [Draconibacterium sp.]|nr:hypothetical protein [Draconibacterium sp.]